MKTKAEVMDFVNETKIWVLATSGETGPNAIPMMFKAVGENGELILCDVFSTTSVNNLKYCDDVCVVAFGAENGPEGYKMYGKAVFYADGPYAEAAEKATAPLRERGMTPKGGAVVVTIDKILVASPGPDNNKEIA